MMKRAEMRTKLRLIEEYGEVPEERNPQDMLMAPIFLPAEVRFQWEQGLRDAYHPLAMTLTFGFASSILFVAMCCFFVFIPTEYPLFSRSFCFYTLLGAYLFTCVCFNLYMAVNTKAFTTATANFTHNNDVEEGQGNVDEDEHSERDDARLLSSSMSSNVVNGGAIAAAARGDEDSTKQQEGQKHKRKSCNKCNKPKPARAHHCRICRKCIKRMDHHCPWVNNCIGIGNYRYFYGLLLHTFVSVSLIACKLYPYVDTTFFFSLISGTAVPVEPSNPKTAEIIARVAATSATAVVHNVYSFSFIARHYLPSSIALLHVVFFMCLFGVCFCGYLFVYHTYLTAFARTTIEVRGTCVCIVNACLIYTHTFTHALIYIHTHILHRRSIYP